MPKTPHFAFKQEYLGLTKRIITDVAIAGISANKVDLYEKTLAVNK